MSSEVAMQFIADISLAVISETLDMTGPAFTQPAGLGTSQWHFRDLVPAPGSSGGLFYV